MVSLSERQSGASGRNSPAEKRTYVLPFPFSVTGTVWLAGEVRRFARLRWDEESSRSGTRGDPVEVDGGDLPGGGGVCDGRRRRL